MLVLTEPADRRVHEASIVIARRCRHIIQAVLREEEWGDADYEFYLVVREELERLLATINRERDPSAANRPAEVRKEGERLQTSGSV